MKIAKNKKKAAPKKKKYVKPSVQSAGMGLMQQIIEFFDQLAKKDEADTMRKTKIDDRHEVETRDYSCKCGKPECPNKSVFMSMVFRDGLPITPLIKATTLEEVEKVHVTAKRRIQQGLAVSQIEAHKDLSHALGNCECHGKESPKA